MRPLDGSSHSPAPDRAAGTPRAAGHRSGCAAASGWAWPGCCWRGHREPRAGTHIWRATCAGAASSPPPTFSCVWILVVGCRGRVGDTARTVSAGAAGRDGHTSRRLLSKPGGGGGCLLGGVSGRLRKGDSCFWACGLPELGFPLFPDIPIWQMR